MNGRGATPLGWKRDAATPGPESRSDSARRGRLAGAARPGPARGHAIVIGSGFGGLAAAIRLRALGYAVTVVERLSQPGGRAAVFRQDGFTFDAGPTIVTAPFLFEELYALAGRRMHDEIDLRSLDPFYRIRFDDGACFDYSGRADAMRAAIERFNPADVAGHARLTAVTREIYRVGFEQLGHVSFSRLRDMLRILPDLVRLQGHRSVYGLVSRYIADERLRTVFSFHPLLVGGNPFTTTAVYSLIMHLEKQHGVHYVMGGTGRLVDSLVDVIRDMGGRFVFDAEVTEIVVADGRARGVRLASGATLAADIVVSNADAAWTYGKLVAPRWRGRWSARRLRRSRSSMGLFVWYFGTDRQYPGVPHHSILLGPRYRGLLDDIFRHQRVADDMSLYLHRPTATDPSLAPPGCDAFYVLSPVPNLDSGTDWNELAAAYRERVARRLADTVLPDLNEHVVTSRVMTPQDFRDRLLSFRGAAFGHEPILRQSAWFRPHNRSERIDGLYLVGAGTHPGAGLPGVVSSAKVLEGLLSNV